MSVTKVVLNLAGFDALRKSPAVKSDLLARAQRIADAAGGGEDYQASVDDGPKRARAAAYTVSAKAMEEEAVNRTLSSAIDAGRG